MLHKFYTESFFIQKYNSLQFRMQICTAHIFSDLGCCKVVNFIVTFD